MQPAYDLFKKSTILGPIKENKEDEEVIDQDNNQITVETQQEATIIDMENENTKNLEINNDLLQESSQEFGLSTTLSPSKLGRATDGL